MGSEAKKLKLDSGAASAKEDLKSAPRPDKGGVMGSKVGLIANHYPVQLVESYLQSTGQYRVDIQDHADKGRGAGDKPEMPKRSNRDWEREKNRKVWQRFRETQESLFNLPNGKTIPMVYDNQAMALIGGEFQLSGQRSFEVIGVPSLKPGKPARNYTLTLSRVGNVGSVTEAVRQGPIDSKDKKNLNMNSVAAVDLVLRQHMNDHSGYLSSAQAFYDTSSTSTTDIGGGKILRKGFTASAKPVQSTVGRFDLSLNADVAHTAFYDSIPLTQVVANVLGKGNQPPARLDQNLQKRLQAELKNYRVETIDGFPKKSFKARGLTSTSAITTEFEDQDANKTTVQQYFRDKYNLDLKYSEWPLAICKAGPKQLTYPLEVLRVVPNQRVANNNLGEQQLAQIIRHAAVKPDVRKDTIHEMIASSGYGVDKLCQDFGIKINLTMLDVPGRKIDAPQMEFLNDRFLTPNNGAWDVRNVQFRKAAPALNKWCYVVCTTEQALSRQSLDSFGRAFSQHANRLGLTVAQHPCDTVYAPSGPKIQDAFEAIAKQGDMQLVVVILPMKKSPIYGDVKTLGDVVTGVLTQCITKQNVDACLSKAGKPQNLQNIAQKVNQKLGGGNCYIKKVDSVATKYFYGPTLLVGADVTHPGAGSAMPSIAAAVGNLDSHPTQFQAQVRVQQSRQEIIDDLKGMMKKLLIGYYKKTGKKPERIVFYRDGVAEGQFKEVLQKELTAIQDACKELEDGYCPKLTFIIVQKRHHTRFFMAKPDPKARNPNIQPGTVVDKAVIHPTDFNFFLCSHQGIQGTSRPTAYSVLYDENGLGSDDAQKLTHQLCHLYGRCARSVSIPAPCYYAHHAAARARHHIKMDAFEGSTSSGSSGQDFTALQKAATVAASLSKSMYYL